MRREAGLGTLGEDGAGADGVDADAGRELAREALGQAKHAGLRGAVGEAACGMLRRPRVCRDGGDVDDASAARGQHPRRYGLRPIEVALEVHCDAMVPLGLGDLQDALGLCHGGVVHQHVDLAPAFLQRRDMVTRRLVLGGVGDDRHGLGAKRPQLTGRGLDLLAPEVHEGYIEAVPRQRQGDAPADSARRPGDDGGPASLFAHRITPVQSVCRFRGATTRRQPATSRAVKAARASDVLLSGRCTWLAARTWKPGLATAATTAWLSRAIVACGVPAGAQTASQDSTTRSGYPASAKVGMPGSCGTRCSLETPIRRTCPSRVKGRKLATDSKVIASRPLITSSTVCWKPR